MDKEILASLGRSLQSQIPDAAERINRHLCEEPLNDMCHEYVECVFSRAHWQKSQSVSTSRIREYDQLLSELRQEILAYLERDQQT